MFFANVAAASLAVGNDMSTLICKHLTFGYQGAPATVFQNLNLVIDCRWRTCLTGANGRGKTTLLKLFSGGLAADTGHIECHRQPRYFPPPVTDPTLSAWQVARRCSGPFVQWEQQMATALAAGDATHLARYDVLQQQYQDAGGYELDARLEAELDALMVSPTLFNKPFNTLSGGEQTRTLLASLFISPQHFALIDEPTNHLDLAGREALASYLAQKSGFILVSHDRTFIDRCCDHVLALNADTTDLFATRFTDWRKQFRQALDSAAARNAQLKTEIARLEQTAAARRAGAAAREAAKSGAMDKGFEGARAARQMKRALSAERRAQQAAQSRRDTLTNIVKQYPIKFSNHRSTMPGIKAANWSVHRDSELFEPVSFSLEAGDRLAISGSNGCGKSSLLQALADTGLHYSGTLARPQRIEIAHLQQEPLWSTGLLAEHLHSAMIDEAAFRQTLAALGLRGTVVDTRLEHLSHGQRKKIDLARTLAIPSHLLLWDEPLNYLDIDAREALEEAIMTAAPTMIFVEHDASFSRRIATKTLPLAKKNGRL